MDDSLSTSQVHSTLRIVGLHWYVVVVANESS